MCGRRLKGARPALLPSSLARDVSFKGGSLSGLELGSVYEGLQCEHVSRGRERAMLVVLQFEYMPRGNLQSETYNNVSTPLKLSS